MAEKMLSLAAKQDGFLHVNSIRDETGLGISISYWRDLASIANWKKQAEHIEAQIQGREKWYTQYRIQICQVEQEYGYEAN